MKTEIWKDITGYEGLYQVSNLGRVKSLPRERKTYGKRTYKTKSLLMDAPISEKGYLRVCLSKDGKQRSYFVHRLVAVAFLDNKNSYPVVNHINGNKLDNRIENLEFCTQSHNVKEAYRIGLEKKAGRRVEQYTKDMELIKLWDSVSEAQRYLGIEATNIVKCCRGKGKTAGGFVWRYYD
jgi:hypothetical protein